MPVEIERKFLVRNDAWKEAADKGSYVLQGYIPTTNETTVRVRYTKNLGTNEEKAFITIKGKTKGHKRSEFEYAVPAEQAHQMLDEFCPKLRVEKTRCLVPYEDKTWEVDVFHGRHEGLVLAEIELDREDDAFKKPAWVGKEVSEDKEYRNSYLATHGKPAKHR